MLNPHLPNPQRPATPVASPESLELAIASFRGGPLGT